MKKKEFFRIGSGKEALGGPLGPGSALTIQKPLPDSPSSANTFGLVPGSPVFVGIRTDTQNDRQNNKWASI